MKRMSTSQPQAEDAYIPDLEGPSNPDDYDVDDDDDVPASATDTTEAVTSYRGVLSPWNVLISALESRHNDHLVTTVQEKAEQIAMDERTTYLDPQLRNYDFRKRFPRLPRDRCVLLIRTYAKEAPYPIVHFDVQTDSAVRLISTGTLPRWGQIVCVLVYLAFGASRITADETHPAAAEEARQYLQEASNLLPKLLNEHDLWALKGLVLLLHYLQAGSEPQECWILLGSALRMAISLGFHESEPVKVGSYSDIELEEGKRAWWLCYIMERTFCAAFDYPTFQGGPSEQSRLENPQPFQPFDTTSDVDKSEIFDENEDDAVQFFIDLMNLSVSHQQILAKRKLNPSQTPDSASSLIHELLNSEQHHRLQSPAAPTLRNLRNSIHTLAHHNLIIVLGMSIRPRSTPLPPECTESARITLHLILSTRTSGLTMCLWMWLHYAFTAAVAVFIHILTVLATTTATPSAADTNTETVLSDVTLLSDLAELCTTLESSSSSSSSSAAASGASRVGRIARQMELAIWEVLKRGARSKKRRRDPPVSEGRQEDDDSDDDDGGSEVRRQRQRSGTIRATGGAQTTTRTPGGMAGSEAEDGRYSAGIASGRVPKTRRLFSSGTTKRLAGQNTGGLSGGLSSRSSTTTTSGTQSTAAAAALTNRPGEKEDRQDQDVQEEDEDDDVDADGDDEEPTDPTADLDTATQSLAQILDTSPQQFEWNDWDQWIEDFLL